MYKCHGDPDVCHKKESRRAAAEAINAKRDRTDESENAIFNAYDSIFIDM